MVRPVKEKKISVKNDANGGENRLAFIYDDVNVSKQSCDGWVA